MDAIQRRMELMSLNPDYVGSAIVGGRRGRMTGGTKVNRSKVTRGATGPNNTIVPVYDGNNRDYCDAYDWPKGFDPNFQDKVQQEIKCRQESNNAIKYELDRENATLDTLAATYKDPAKVDMFRGFPYLAKGAGLSDPYGGCYGTGLVGGRKKKAKTTRKKGLSTGQKRWQAHIKATLKAHPALKHDRPKLLKAASRTYKY